MSKFRNTQNSLKGIVQDQKSNIWYIRKSYEGKQRELSLSTKNKQTAEKKFKLFNTTAARFTFNAALKELNGSLVVKGQNLSYEDIVHLYKEFQRTKDNSVADRTSHQYQRCLKNLMDDLDLKYIEGITYNRVEEYKNRYLEKARSEDRDTNSSKKSLASILRNVKSIFSKKSLVYYRHQFGREVLNPFTDVSSPETTLTKYKVIDRSLIESIVADLQDRTHDEHMIFWLAYGAGLRRNEIDKLKRSSFIQLPDGRPAIRIKNEPDFIPKHKVERDIPIPEILYSNLKEYRKKCILELSSDPKTQAELRKQIYLIPTFSHKAKFISTEYRLPKRFRNVCSWLHAYKGIEAKPLHQFRKEFGATVASKNGIYVAQKLLGHQHIATTDRYYADLITQTTAPDVMSKYGMGGFDAE